MCLNFPRFQFLNVLALGILAAIIRNPTMMQELESGYDDFSKITDTDAPALPTPLSKIDPPYAYRDHSLNYRKWMDIVPQANRTPIPILLLSNCDMISIHFVLYSQITLTWAALCAFA